MMANGSILVTGGAGYLGSILVPELLKSGYRVTVLDNFMYQQNSLAQVCADPNFDVVNGDTRSAELLKPLVAKADAIIPLAALVGAPLCNRDPIAAVTALAAGVVFSQTDRSDAAKALQQALNRFPGIWSVTGVLIG